MRQRGQYGAAPTAESPGLRLADLLDHGDPREVIGLVEGLYRKSFPRSDFSPIAAAFRQALRLFAGRFPGYLACDTEYHDLRHSLSAFSATSRLLDGARLTGTLFSDDEVSCALVAALLHDSGYIRAAAGETGGGALNARNRVGRAIEFAARNAAAFGLDEERSRLVRDLIGGSCGEPAREEAEAPVGNCLLLAQLLAAAHLLGQMSDRIYLEKLLFLYYEFREAEVEGYATAFDILRKTASFYGSARARLDGPLAAASGFARPHFAARYGVDRDLFREAIERQMAYLDLILADDRVNFRRKLKRMDLESADRQELA